MQEVKHIIDILEKTKKEFHEKDSISLKNLSNQTIHSSCCFQDSASISLMVIIYTLSKLLERKDQDDIKKMSTLEKRLHPTIQKAIDNLKSGKFTEYQDSIRKLRTTIESFSIDLKPYIKDLMKKAAINKAGKIYEHGLSMEKTAKLLGITQWELAEYAGQKSTDLDKSNEPITTKQRAKMAMEFFS